MTGSKTTPKPKAKSKPATPPASVVDQDAIERCMIFSGISPETKQAHVTKLKSGHRSKTRKT